MMRVARLKTACRSEHLDFFHALPYYHEDDYAIYVHAGLDRDKHPSETAPQALLWMRDMEFYKNYRGKPCIFGHTPTPLLPLRGRVGPPWHLHFSQRHRHRYRLQHSVSAKLSCLCLTLLCIRRLPMGTKKLTTSRRSSLKH